MDGLGWAIAAIVAWGVLTFGAVYPWASWPLVGAAGALGLWQLVLERAWEDARSRHLAIAVAVVTVAILLQTVPLPSWYVANVSPAVDRFFREFEVFYQPRRMQALSLDPAGTAVVLALWIGFALLLVGIMRSLRRVSLEPFLTVLMSLGAGVGLLAIVQDVVARGGTPKIYGVWTPPAGAVPFGPFINKEHFAGWMVLTLPLAAGYTLALLRESVRAPEPGSKPGRWRLRSVGTARRLGAVAAVGIMAASVIMTGSRAGLASLAIGLAVATADGWRRDRKGQTRLFAVVVAAVVVAVAAWAVVGVIDRGTSRLPGLADRWPVWQDTVRIARDFPVSGSGLGTFARAMQVYQTDGREVMFAQAHNDYLQLWAEGGATVVLPALAVIIVLGLIIRRRLAAGEDDPITRGIRLGAVGGLAGIAAFEFVQFSLQIPGIAVCFVVLLALAVHRPRRRLAHANRI